jgi:hypothetical protein
VTTLKEYLTQEIANWETIGHPALLQRFVLRNGKPYTPRKRIGRRGTPKECFANAAKIVVRKPRPDHVLTGWGYVEGFAVHRTEPIMAFHHAWVTTDRNDAMDPTLDAEQYEYFGVEFELEVLMQQIRRNRVYGLLDPGMGLNYQLMFEVDPQLEAVIKKVRPSPAWTAGACK